MATRRQPATDRGKGIPWCLILSLAGLLFQGCTRGGTPVERGNREQVLYRSLSADPTDLDPHLVTGLPGLNVAATLFEGLVAEDPVDLHPVPGVAERWEVSSNGLDYVFHLRANARWSNGAPVTAEDFVASGRRALTRRLGASDVDLLFPVRKARAYYEGALADFAQVGLNADDPHTLRIRLEHPVPSFLSILAHPVWFPVYLPALERTGSPLDRDNPWTRPENFVGNGPFVLKAWNHGSLILVEKSPTYWEADAVRLQAIRFVPADSVDAEERAFRAGQLHITEALPLARIEAYRRAHDPALQITPFLDTYFYRLNVTRPFLGDARVRRALSLALDRRTIVETILHGEQQPAHSFTPPKCNPAYRPPELAADDPAAARALLAAAGFPGGKGLPPLELLINNSGNHQLVAEAVQAMWRRELGVETHIVSMEQSSALEQRAILGYQILRSDWAADYAGDPLAFLSIFASDSNDNHTGWKNPEYDSLLTQAQATADTAERLALLRRAEQILLMDAPVIPIYHLTTIRLVQPSVHSWHPTLLDHHPYKHVWLEP